PTAQCCCGLPRRPALRLAPVTSPTVSRRGRAHLARDTASRPHGGGKREQRRSRRRRPPAPRGSPLPNAPHLTTGPPVVLAARPDRSKRVTARASAVAGQARKAIPRSRRTR